MGVLMTYRRVLDWMIGFIDNLYRELGTIDHPELSLIYTLYVHHYTPTRVLSLH
jgi:hypothetical protein